MTVTEFDSFRGRDVHLYTLTGDGLTVGVTDFGAAVSIRILLPQENAAGFDAALTELSAGTMTARREGERFLPGPRE